MGTELGETMYHVLLEGRKVGPYDRRTVVGMRIRKTLTGDHVLVATDGTQLTVAELIGKPQARPFNADRSGSFSLVRATFTASLVEVRGAGIAIPRFKGEVEARVQADVLRIAGRFRRGLGWKEDRVKIPLGDIVHARIKGSQVDLWLRPAHPGGSMQRVSLELFTHESAGELVDWLPSATPWPESAGPADGPRQGNDKVLWVAGAGLAGAVVVILVLVLVAALQRHVI